MVDNNELQIKVTAVGGDAAAAEVKKVTSAVKEQQTAVQAGAGVRDKSVDQAAQALAIQHLLTDAAKLEAAGLADTAKISREIAEERALALQLQKRFALSEEAALVMARERLNAERQVAQAKAAEATQARLLAQAEKEAAAAVALRAREEKEAERQAESASARRLAMAGRMASAAGLGSFGGMVVAGQKEGMGMLGAAGIGGAIGTALVTVGNKALAAEEEMRKLNYQAEIAQQTFTTGLHFAGLGEIPAIVSNAASSIAGLQDRIDTLVNQKSSVSEMVGRFFTGEDDPATKAAKLQEEDSRQRANIGIALTKQAELGKELVRIAELRAAGQTKEADEAQRLLDLNNKIAQIHAAALPGTGTAAAVKEMIAQAKAISEAAKEAKELAAAKKEIALIEGAVDAAEHERLIAEGLTEQAALLKDQIALRKELKAIEEDADASAEQKEVRAALAEEKFQQGIARRAKAIRDRDAQAEEEAVRLKEEFDADNEEKAAREAERAAEKAARAAEHDAEAMERLRGGLAVAQEKLALDEDGARTAGIQRDLDAQIANIRKTMLPENQGIAIALAEQTAEMQKQLVLQQRFNKDFDVARGQLGKGWEEKAAEQLAAKKGAQQDRIVAQKILDAEDKARREAGLPALSNEARIARKDEILRPRGASREARDRAERDGAIGRMVRKPGTDTDFTGQGADFGGGGGGGGAGGGAAAAASQQAAAAAQALDSSLAQSGAATAQALQQAAQNSQQAAAIASRLLNALVQGKSDLKNLEARVESLENRE
jgi:hypothetical protein